LRWPGLNGELNGCSSRPRSVRVQLRTPAKLAGIFAIDVAAYAVMSNHFHVVVRIDRERALGWSVEEVLRRWTKLFSGPLLVTRCLSEARAEMCAAEIAETEALAETYRARLHDLSWLMRTLNEYIARQANAEDGVKGRFWEGRFKGQAGGKQDTRVGTTGHPPRRNHGTPGGTTGHPPRNHGIPT
jgi:hypothetical protein